MTKLKHTTLAVASIGAAALASTAFVGAAYADTTSSSARLISGVYTSADRPALLNAQFIWGGRNYCFYSDGWNGPGFYWCGYAWRHGWGWGGPEGWHGWGHSYRGYYRGGGWGRHYHGGYYRGGGDYRGGGWGHGGYNHDGYSRGGEYHHGGGYNHGGYDRGDEHHGH